MSVKAINPSLNRVQYRNNNVSDIKNKQVQSQKQPSFSGLSLSAGIVSLMDWIEAGGFITSFIIQDGLGMVAPRIGTGLMRGRGSIDPNTGEKRGCNWEFARREALRELLSGPSAYLIPLAMISGIKKLGKANNVPVDLINGYGSEFAKYSKQAIAENKPLNKIDFYTQIFDNLLTNSTDGTLPKHVIEEKSATYAKQLIEIEDNHGNKKIRKVLENSLKEDFINIRRLHSDVMVDDTAAVLKSDDKYISKGIKKILSSLSDYTHDALHYTHKHLKEDTPEAVEKLINNFNLKRTGTRVVTNLSMWGAVAAGFILIPKIYNLGLKHDPGLVGTAAEGTMTENAANTAQNTKTAETAKDTPEDNKQQADGKQVSFAGWQSSLGKTVLNNNKLGKFLKNFEFDNASMPANAMAAALFGFCLPPRYIDAKSNFERGEILFRDITSFIAILFGAKALSRVFSQTFTKMSGIALQVRDEGFEKRSLPGKVWQYFSANSDISNLTSRQLEAKYANPSGAKNGILGMIDFIQNNHGDVRKAFSIDKGVKENIEKLLGGKSIKNATVDEIKNAIKNGAESVELKNIYKILDNVKGNKLLGRAKLLNSLFDALSTFALVPLFMIWVSHKCTKMTKERSEKLAKEAAEAANANKPEPPKNPTAQVQNVTAAADVNKQPSMQGFLNNL